MLPPLRRAAAAGRAWLPPLRRGAARGLAGRAESVQVQPALLHIEWEDGTKSQLNPNWLRERCLSSAAVDASTRQPLANPHDLPEQLHLAEARLSGKSLLDVVFSDGHRSQFSLPRVQSELSNFVDSPIQVSEYDRLSPVPWSGDSYEVPVYEHDSVSEDEGERLKLIKDLLTSGAALVKGVPPKEGEVCRFGQTLSTLRATDWGPCFNVRTKPDADQSNKSGGPKLDLAYTPRPIGFHTDNPYRFPCPDFQLLHALEHCTCPPGEAPCEGCSVMNYLVDGLYIAEKLREESPEAFRLLTEVPVRFENNGGDGGSALVHVAPHIELGGDGRIQALRFSAKSGQYAPPLAAETMQAFYVARRRFSQLAHEAKHIASMQFEPGDCLVFDNQRLLHARSEILPSDGDRWVQGCYIDRDGLWLNYERWRRRAAP